MLPLALLKTAQGHPVVRFVWSCAPVAPTWAQAGAGMCLEQRSCIGSHPIVLPSPLAADRTQERRDVQWAPCSVRYLDERAPAGSHLHRKGALFMDGLGCCIQRGERRQGTKLHALHPHICRMAIGFGGCPRPTSGGTPSSTCGSRMRHVVSHEES